MAIGLIYRSTRLTDLQTCANFSCSVVFKDAAVPSNAWSLPATILSPLDYCCSCRPACKTRTKKKPLPRPAARKMKMDQARSVICKIGRAHV